MLVITKNTQTFHFFKAKISKLHLLLKLHWGTYNWSKCTSNLEDLKECEVKPKLHLSSKTILIIIFTVILGHYLVMAMKLQLQLYIHLQRVSKRFSYWNSLTMHIVHILWIYFWKSKYFIHVLKKEITFCGIQHHATMAVACIFYCTAECSLNFDALSTGQH